MFNGSSLEPLIHFKPNDALTVLKFSPCSIVTGVLQRTGASVLATNLTSAGPDDAVITYSLSTSIPITYHTQLQSWYMKDKSNMYYASTLVHAVRQNLFIAAEYEDGDSIWIALDSYKLYDSANEDFSNQNEGELKSSITECEDGTEECKMEIKNRETVMLTLSIFSSYISGTYSVNIHEAGGHQDALHFSKPVITLGDSYKHAPEESILVRPRPPSDSGILEQVGRNLV